MIWTLTKNEGIKVPVVGIVRPNGTALFSLNRQYGKIAIVRTSVIRALPPERTVKQC
jgi:hypothetical protein